MAVLDLNLILLYPSGVFLGFSFVLFFFLTAYGDNISTSQGVRVTESSLHSVLLQKGESERMVSSPGLRQVPGTGCQVRFLGFTQERSQERAIVKGEWVDLERCTLHRQNALCLRSQGVTPGCGGGSFYGLGNFILWWAGRIFCLFGGRGKDFQKLGLLCSTVLAPLGGSFSKLMYYNDCIMKLKVNWESNLLPSWA